ncbi:hypothetical protein ASPZODRAFT_1668563 [Penicilliopsis zonata CBS 506.65]|uniref:Uncharacterized protein n=1 Tax=Penicilliopsis zonata CBS 506.65 TaxID=1073090 RepID=A0A1L9S4H5_9EURO|nr:hypothetical protein ASPZODRAFT_1668563 [Penicilliopsis zonata CBS 506.65]OJJ42054.1 hypothetical protein ASPZODRAFT_1668563 [Penicilliopsis zonata CBS 506.65]
MDSNLLFQLTASTIASVCCGSSLALWLISIKALSWQRLKNEPLITAQATIGALVFLGSILSVLLSILRANLKTNLPWLILQLEISCVLVLVIVNEYLCVSTLQHWTSHMISAFSCLGAVIILSLSVSFPRSILLSSFIIIAFIGLSLIHAQIIRAWVICIRPWHMDTSAFKSFWHYPCPDATRHQRALWMASIGSVGLFTILLGLVILACVQTNLQTQIVTIQIAITSLRKVAISSCLLQTPHNNLGVLLSHEHA